MPQTPATYEQLERRIAAWAPSQPAIRAVLAVGSRARGDADQWSDLDVLILTTDRPFFASNSAWLGAFGDLWLSYSEPTDLGDPEWYAVYAGGVKLDAVLIQVDDPAPPLDALMQPLPYQGVFGRGVKVLYDRQGEPRTIPPNPHTPEAPPSEAEFNNVVSGFLMASATTAKFIARGDYWRAQGWFAQDLRAHLLTLIRWHAQGKDTWYGGRFMEQWADPRVVAALPGAFATLNRESLQSALLTTLDTFRWIAEETAARFGFAYPAETHEQVEKLVRATLASRGE